MGYHRTSTVRSCNKCTGCVIEHRVMSAPHCITQDRDHFCKHVERPLWHHKDAKEIRNHNRGNISSSSSARMPEIFLYRKGRLQSEICAAP